MRETGRSNRAIGRPLQRTETDVQRCCQQWLLRETYRRNEGSGRPRRSNSRQYWMTIRQARTAPKVSLSTIQRITASSIPPVVPFTISRRLSDLEVTLTAALKAHVFDSTISAESSGEV
ncbi:uncharacterized protein TNCV_3935491 [Trichonephila clavipes]|nr:uncharacterized protein TNCV_3935491 [Trichonephila clavipes]